MTFTPQSCGLPARFSKWRRRQSDALWRIVNSEKRVRCCVMPTGFGKTVVYMSSLLLQGHRGAVLTSNKSQEDQVIREFESVGLVDVRGAGNYECRLKLDSDADRRTLRMCDHGHCRVGHACEYRQMGCSYFDAYRHALEGQLVVTNYSYWMAQHAYGEGLGPFDTLVLDEAHLAPDELSDFLSVSIAESDILRFGLGYPSHKDWRPWVREALARMGATLRSETVVDNVVPIKRLVTSLERLQTGDAGDWVMEHLATGFKWDVIWPHAYAEASLFLGIKNIVLVSATMRKKTLQLLGLDPKAVEWIEYPSDFPIERRPVYFLPTTKVFRRMEDKHKLKLRNRIDEIISKRRGRKGIVHTVSYALRDDIVQHTRHAKTVRTNKRRELKKMLEEHFVSEEGVIVSPSVHTGFDFPYRQAEFQIIAKIPFPDQASRVVQIRSQGDPEYGIYLALQTLVQSVGRPMRAKDDRAETFIIDDNWRWLWWKYQHHLPRWFRDAVQTRYSVPVAPPRAKRVDKDATL